ncbi:MAG: type VI secretion system baseplate subunit TssF [Bacteroidetes bacterium]|nr:type VI secretion system baseplate subunit TssF [Bacteroidota bacterium]
MESSELTTERIRSRMLKNAARIWGAESEDVESSFDPLVTMMIEACASELNKINGEILTSQSRILNRLAQILSPETLVGPQPAHAIAHARSIEPFSDLSRDVQFFTTKKVPSSNALQKEVNKEIYFSPADNFRIFDADIKYTACNNLLYEYKTPTSRQLITEGPVTSYLNPSEMWIGIELQSRITSIRQLSFYFDWKNDPEEEKYLHMLPLTKWSLNGIPLKVEHGIVPSEEKGSHTNGKISDQYDVTLRIEDFIGNFYKNQFYSLEGTEIPDGKLQEMKTSYPKELEEVFSNQVLSKIQGNYLWLKLQFTTAFPMNSISDLYVSINSFPIINRQLNKFTYRVQNNLNIVPLATDDLFLDLLSVQTADGKPFLSNPLGTGFNNEAGYYTLRYGGVERFDDRHAVELLNNVLDLLRDESAAFSSLGNDFISAYIRQINTAIAMIEHSIEQKGQKARPGNFLLINPYNTDENIYTLFWSTNGFLANQIKAGVKLQNYSGVDARAESLMLMSTTSGGKDPLSENERITAYKKALLTHDRIVTEQDIRNMCFHEFGNLIQSVSVRKAWEVVADRKQGIRRVLEINIVPARNNSLNSYEWRNLAKEFQVKLDQYSANLIPLKVLVTGH